MEYYNRYGLLRLDNTNYMSPRITIPESSTDKIIVFKRGITRFDVLSQEYYENPLFGFLILSANPKISGMEFDIETGTIIRIPFPLNKAISLYNNELKNYIDINGLK